LAGGGGQSDSEWSRIVAEFSPVMQEFSVASSPAHSVQHIIQTPGWPTTAKFHCLDPQKLAAAKMLAAGVVRR
jgi:hypothetical protein